MNAAAPATTAAAAAGPTTSAGQKSILSFYQVAARRAHASAGQLGVASSSGTTPEPDAHRRAASAPAEPDCSSGWCSSGGGDGSDSGSGAAADGMGDDDVDSSSQPEPSKAPQPDRQQSPEACCGPGLQLCGPLLVSTRVVGRQHQSAGWPPASGCRLQLVREANNPVDPCAILVGSACAGRRGTGARGNTSYHAQPPALAQSSTGSIVWVLPWVLSSTLHKAIVPASTEVRSARARGALFLL